MVVFVLFMQPVIFIMHYSLTDRRSNAGCFLFSLMLIPTIPHFWLLLGRTLKLCTFVCFDKQCCCRQSSLDTFAGNTHQGLMCHSLKSNSMSLAGGNGSYEASVHANGEWTRKILVLSFSEHCARLSGCAESLCQQKKSSETEAEELLKFCCCQVFVLHRTWDKSNGKAKRDHLPEYTDGKNSHSVRITLNNGL